MELSELKQIVEALLVATPEPLTTKRFGQCFKEDTVPEIELSEIIDALSEDYQSTNRAFIILNVAGGYQLATKSEFEPFVSRLFSKSSKLRLSQAALETLAIVSYRQPVTRNDIEAIRGVNSDSPLRTLLERKLIEIRGRDEGPGRALLYRTSTEFLQYFGLNSVDDLPKLREVEELISEEDDHLV